MFKRYPHFLLLAIIVVMNITVLPKSAFATGCLSAAHAPGCSYGLPTDQYQQLLGVMGANPRPALHPLEVDQKEILKYSDTRQKPGRIASSFTGNLFDAPPPLPVAWILNTTRPRVLPLWLADHVPDYI